MEGLEWQSVQADMSPESDFPPTECRLKYLVCTTPRSGSWLLCTGLAATGQAGRPAEFFTPVYGQAYRARLGLTRLVPVQYWNFLLEHRTSPNGVFGMKIHFDQMEKFFPNEQAQKQFLARFDRLIFLTRRDKLAQAVSFWKARATGVYRMTANTVADSLPPPSVSYRFGDIAHALALLATREQRWLSLLSHFADRTFSLDYEDLAGNYGQSLERALIALGLGVAVSAIDPQPRVLPQRDHVNEEWERLFVEDLRGSAAQRIVRLAAANTDAQRPYGDLLAPHEQQA